MYGSDDFLDLSLLDELEMKEANDHSGFLKDTTHEVVPASAFLRNLTEEQAIAVTAGDGPVLVLAGAGSGKTRVLTTRIAYRLEKGDITPAHVLALTFTRKAAGEMRERLERLIGPAARHMDIGTFHAVFARVMRELDGAFGAPTQSTILDEKDQKLLLKDAIKDAGYLDNVLKDKTPQQILEDMAGYRMAQHFKDRFPEHRSTINIGAVTTEYERAKKRENVLDYDDVLFRFDEVLDHPRAREIMMMRWKMVLVDEYQDTNAIQESILKKIARGHGNITCVGDDDQSIYSFRHADVSNILEFEDRWPGATIVRLQQNFRSTSAILTAANKLIAHNTLRHGKVLVPTREEGASVIARGFASGMAEADAIGQEISDLIEQGVARKNIAVIARTASVLQVVEQQLIRKRIPYTITSGRRVADRVESKIIAAYIRAAINPLDETALIYAFESKKRKMGATGLAKLKEQARQAHVTLEEAMRNYAQSGGELGANGKPTPSSVEKALSLHEFLDGLERVRAQIALEASPIDIVDVVIDISDINETLEAEYQKAQKKQEREIQENAARKYEQQKLNIESLRMAASESATIEDMSANIVLSADRDDLASDAVWLGTIHAAKGLEFDNVFLPGFEHGIIPSKQSESDTDSYRSGGVDEERNLAYVAITRAKNRLMISYADNRMIYGKTQEGGPSMFLREAFTDI
ncbi:MAG: ATP-dependent helicase [Phreatobacter sp.]|nr:ATP-dependent helicase [Phreatobacter sp.]